LATISAAPASRKGGTQHARKGANKLSRLAQEQEVTALQQQRGRELQRLLRHMLRKQHRPLAGARRKERGEDTHAIVVLTREHQVPVRSLRARAAQMVSVQWLIHHCCVAAL
jgi:hypothetical protein